MRSSVPYTLNFAYALISETISGGEMLGTPTRCHTFKIDVDARDDHYPVCRLAIRQDSEFATGYGYPKNCSQTETGYGSEYPKRFYRYFENSGFWKMLHNHSLIIFRSIFSAFCAMTPSLSVV